MNPTTATSSQLGLVSVETDQGITGNAFLGTSFRGADLDAHSLIKYLKPLLMGEDPRDRERIFRALCRRVRHSTWRAIGALDVALWDVAGKATGTSIHKLLGGYRDSVPAYVSSETLADPKAYVEDALAAKAAGFTAYKLHPPAPLDQCFDACRLVREAVGDDYRLMLDASWEYDFQQAMRLGLHLQDLGYYWYEDPLADDDIYGYTKLREKLTIPIMATEYSPGGIHFYSPWILAKATDYLRGDVAVKGGITAVMKTAHLAECFRMNYEIHHGGNSLNNVANLHCILAMQNCEYFEILLPDTAQKYGLVEDIAVDRNGMVHAFDGAGLGAKIDFDLIERKKLAVLR